MSPRRRWVFGTVVVALGCGCGPRTTRSPPSTVPEAKTDDAVVDTSAALPERIQPKDRPELTITLPPSPDFERPDVPHVYDDGAYSIAGIRADLDARVAEGERGEVIEVWAYVREIYQGPDCGDDPMCRRKQPHLWVVDEPGDRSRIGSMLVAHYKFQIPEWEADEWKDEPEVQLSEGQRYRFRVKITRRTESEFAAADGLMVFIAVQAPDAAGKDRWVFPRGSSWHPRTQARQEEANRALSEAAVRSAQETQRKNKRKRKRKSK